VSPRGLAYAVRGSGPPLLWLSGFAIASRSLDRVVDRFSEHYMCITFDPRGSGRSRPSVGPMTTSRMAWDALDVLRALDVPSAHVYGLSLGGMVAQELAIKAPHRVTSMVLGATTPGGTAAIPPRPGTLWVALRDARDVLPGAGHISRRGALLQAWAAATHDATPRLARIQTPTLVVHGDRDMLVPLVNARALAELIPHAELAVVEGAGHFYFVEQLGPASDLVLDWLASQHEAVGSERAVRAPVETAVDLVAAPWRHARSQLLPLHHALVLLSPKAGRMRNGRGTP
jgi:3-oxoadipate enol-lactonase